MGRHPYALAMVLAWSLASTSVLAREKDPGPEILNVEPLVPAPSTSPQLIRVVGRYFGSPITLTVTTPGGTVVDYRGSALADRHETWFRATVLFEDIGVYRLAVTNPDGQTSSVFTITAKARTTAPVVSRVRPENPARSGNPQAITVEGSRFAAGLSVMVTDPVGNVQTITGAALATLEPGLVRATVLLDLTGNYDLVIVNPDGQSSNIVTFTVVSRRFVARPVPAAYAPGAPSAGARRAASRQNAGPVLAVPH